MHNLNNAFTVAEEKLGITKLLDPEGEAFPAKTKLGLYMNVRFEEHKINNLKSFNFDFSFSSFVY